MKSRELRTMRRRLRAQGDGETHLSAMPDDELEALAERLARELGEGLLVLREGECPVCGTHEEHVPGSIPHFLTWGDDPFAPQWPYTAEDIAAANALRQGKAVEMSRDGAELPAGSAGPDSRRPRRQ